MRLNTSTLFRQWLTVSCTPLLLALLFSGCQEDVDSAPDTPPLTDQTAAAPVVERVPADASPTESALATLRAHWDSEVITGAMVDEIKNVIEAGSPEDLEPLLDRLDLLEQSGDAYSADFALWWNERGRNDLGGKLFWKRDIMREAISVAFQGGNEREALRLFGEAAATDDPVARMWKSFADAELSGAPYDPDAMGRMVAFAGEARRMAESGDADAAFILGLFAQDGDGDMISSTPEEIVRWLEMAAEGGYEHAAQLLAEIYSRGRHGVAPDRAKAREWSTKGEASNPEQHASRDRTNSANNLKQLGLVSKMFANESRGEKWPPLSPIPGQLAMDDAAVFPEYLTDPTIYISPAHPDYYDLEELAESDARSVLRDHSYWYLGYAIGDEAQGLEFVKQIREAAEAGETLTEDLDSPESLHERIFRLREGIERFFITDINNPQASAVQQRTLPVIIERPGMHETGANVLYLDGHVEFIDYPGKFPMTVKFIEALKSLDDLKS